MAATITKTKSDNQKAAKWTSRAALRLVEPGSWVRCTHCDETIKFSASARHQQVICNIYTKGVWQRVEHWHADCYEALDAPHGAATD